jgi:hypothetical protein
VPVTQPSVILGRAGGWSRHHRPADQPPISGVARLVAIGFAVCLLEGAGRKWLVNNPSFSVQAIFYFAKDFVFVAAALAALSSPARSSQIQGLKQSLTMAAVMIFLAAMVNFENLSPVGAVVSVRNALLLPWLALIIAPALRSQRDIDFLLKTIGFGAVGVAILGGLQFYLPGGHVLNKQVHLDHGLAMHGSRIRASGTFAFLSGMTDLAMLGSWAGTCLLLRNPRQLLLGGLFVVAGLTCTSAAVSRAGILGVMVILIFSSLLLPTGRREVIGLLLLFFLAGMYLAQDIGDQDEFGLASSTFVRFTSGGDPSGRLLSILHDPWVAIQEVPAGVGLGVGQSASAMMKVPLPVTVRLESELGRVVLEIGIVGLLAVIVFRISVLRTLWTSGGGFFDSAQSTVFVPLRMASFVAVGTFFAGMTYINHVGATFAWLIVMIALGTCEIEARSMRSEKGLPG